MRPVDFLPLVLLGLLLAVVGRVENGGEVLELLWAIPVLAGMWAVGKNENRCHKNKPSRESISGR